MIAGAPGGGKSAMASFWALHLPEINGSKPRGIYLSADCDKLTFGKSAVASALNIHVNEAEKKLNENDPAAWAKLDEMSDHMWMSFQEGPSPRDIREEVDAFAYATGGWPEFLVVDNLMDVDAHGGGDDERTSQDAVIDFLKRLAKQTGMAVIILLHVVGAYEDGATPIPLSGLMNKVGKRARLTLTLCQEQDNVLSVYIVKNSNGPANASCNFGTYIPWLPELHYMGTGAKHD